MTDLTNYVSGKPVPRASGRFADVFNPATGAVEKRVPLASTAEVDAAVAVAKAAWPAWAKTPPLRRARILDKFKALLIENADRIAELISAEHGKTHDDALGEVTRGLEASARPALRPTNRRDALRRKGRFGRILKRGACGTAREDPRTIQPGSV